MRERERVEETSWLLNLLIPPSLSQVDISHFGLTNVHNECLIILWLYQLDAASWSASLMDECILGQLNLHYVRDEEWSWGNWVKIRRKLISGKKCLKFRKFEVWISSLMFTSYSLLFQLCKILNFNYCNINYFKINKLPEFHLHRIIWFE